VGCFSVKESFPKMHGVTSPPAPEEALGCTRRCVSRPTAARRLLGRDGGAGGGIRNTPPAVSLGTFHRWKVPPPAGERRSAVSERNRRRRLLARRCPKTETKAESRAFVSREAGVQRDEVSPQPVSKCSLSEPTVPTPHSLFVSPKRERAVDGTREKGDRGSQGRLVRPPPDPLLSVRLTEVCTYRKISEIEKHPVGVLFSLRDR